MHVYCVSQDDGKNDCHGILENGRGYDERNSEKSTNEDDMVGFEPLLCVYINCQCSII